MIRPIDGSSNTLLLFFPSDERTILFGHNRQLFITRQGGEKVKVRRCAATTAVAVGVILLIVRVIVVCHHIRTWLTGCILLLYGLSTLNSLSTRLMMVTARLNRLCYQTINLIRTALHCTAFPSFLPPLLDEMSLQYTHTQAPPTQQRGVACAQPNDTLRTNKEHSLAHTHTYSVHGVYCI